MRQRAAFAVADNKGEKPRSATQGNRRHTWTVFASRREFGVLWVHGCTPAVMREGTRKSRDSHVELSAGGDVCAGSRRRALEQYHQTGHVPTLVLRCMLHCAQDTWDSRNVVPQSGVGETDPGGRVAETRRAGWRVVVGAGGQRLTLSSMPWVAEKRDACAGTATRALPTPGTTTARVSVRTAARLRRHSP
ncbi:hypothetical protein BD626DRAFT_509300 [Schizophyllum amplum]|uniref:Uncharacterized protein n=1 Tax=Schizophyllum amplum TaxID=97359 RepID=A0A550C366_9AGAR|nr:hypothetical protein BD626DRAFT_509300 [Auriculariopsis ampla]